MTKKNKSSQTNLLAALQRDQLRRSKGAPREMRLASEAAHLYFKKNARINIRMSKPDLTLIKRKAAENGMPYQSFISSILHNLAMGRIP